MLQTLTVYEWRRLIRTSNLSPRARFVALVLSDYLNTRTLEADPGVARLTRECGYSPESARSIQRAIRELQSHGYLWVSYRGKGPNTQQTNLYRAQRPKWLGGSETPSVAEPIAWADDKEATRRQQEAAWRKMAREADQDVPF